MINTNKVKSKKIFLWLMNYSSIGWVYKDYNINKSYLQSAETTDTLGVNDDKTKMVSNWNNAVINGSNSSKNGSTNCVNDSDMRPNMSVKKEPNPTTINNSKLWKSKCEYWNTINKKRMRKRNWGYNLRDNGNNK